MSDFQMPPRNNADWAAVYAELCRLRLDNEMLQGIADSRAEQIYQLTVQARADAERAARWHAKQRDALIRAIRAKHAALEEALRRDQRAQSEPEMEG